jgi:signal transduction histidine kinase
MLVLAAAEQPNNLLRAPLDIEDLVVAAARRWSRTADRVWRVDAAIHGVLIADRHRLDAALDAIIDNAVQATGSSDRIGIGAHADDDVAVLTVADSGVGIPADAMPRIFDRFWSIRYEPERRRGTGLGLAIVKAIVEAHDGSVSVRSTPRAGTTVTLRLPGLSPDHAVVERGERLAVRGSP